MAKSGSLNGKLVVLMGGSGFIGNYVAQALLERGARVRIASRHPEKAFKLKPLANLGQMQFARCDAGGGGGGSMMLRNDGGKHNYGGKFPRYTNAAWSRGTPMSSPRIRAAVTFRTSPPLHTLDGGETNPSFSLTM